MTGGVGLRRKLATELDLIESKPYARAGKDETRECKVTDPRLASLLETAERLAEALRGPVPPPRAKLQLGRAQLLVALAQQPRRSSFRGKLATEIHFAAKVFAVLMALVVVLAPLSPRIVGAARDSMPGQLFYPLKLHMERVQFEGTAQPDVRVSLGLAFLGERVAEAQALAGTGRTLDYQTVSEVHQLTNQVLHAVAQTPEVAMAETLVYVSRQLGAYLEVLDALNAQATPPNAASLDQIRQAVQKGHTLTLHALDDPAQFRAAYQAGRPELFLLPGENPLGEAQAPSNATTNTHQEK
jgi:hypothetical protein